MSSDSDDDEDLDMVAVILLLVYSHSRRMFRLEADERIIPDRSVFAGKLHSLRDGSNAMYKQNFRMEKETFHTLLARLNTVAGCSRKTPMLMEMRLAIFLHRMGHLGDVRAFAYHFGVEKSVITRNSAFIANLISTHLFHEQVRLPADKKELQDVEKRFFKLCGLDGVIGAIDGCHIKLWTKEGVFRNYKRFYSLNCLFACEDNGIFTYALIGKPGRMNDASLLTLSSLFQAQENDVFGAIPQPYYFLVDGGFPGNNWLQTRFTRKQIVSKNIDKNLRKERISFNQQLSSGRQVIERAFGRLKGRWARLRTLDVKEKQRIAFITAGVVLHNLCERAKDEYELTDADIKLQKAQEVPQPRPKSNHE